MSKKLQPGKATPTRSTEEIHKEKCELLKKSIHEARAKELDQQSKILSSKHIAEVLKAVGHSLYMEMAVDMPIRYRTNFNVALESEYLKRIGRDFREGRKKGSTSAGTDHIHKLALENPDASAKEIFSMTDKSIIGKMAYGTFANKVTAARNPKK